MARKRAIPHATRQAVALKAGVAPGEQGIEVFCHWCGKPGFASWFPRRDGRPGGWVHFQDLELDHVLPESLGGTEDPSNIVLACRRCNRTKGARVWER